MSIIISNKVHFVRRSFEHGQFGHPNRLTLHAPNWCLSIKFICSFKKCFFFQVLVWRKYKTTKQKVLLYCLYVERKKKSCMHTYTQCTMHIGRQKL